MSDTPRSILLVIEDALLADVTSFRLELLGYRVQCAGTAEEAHRKLVAEVPNLIVLDTHLPDVPGVELLSRISADARTAVIPALMISTDADLDTVRRAHLAGARDFLVIPYDPATLEHKIEKLLEAAPAKKH